MPFAFDKMINTDTKWLLKSRLTTIAIILPVNVSSSVFAHLLQRVCQRLDLCRQRLPSGGDLINELGGGSLLLSGWTQWDSVTTQEKRQPAIDDASLWPIIMWINH